MNADTRRGEKQKKIAADFRRYTLIISGVVGNDRVRRCAECNLNVYNFAAIDPQGALIPKAEITLARKDGKKKRKGVTGAGGNGRPVILKRWIIY